MEEMDYKLIDAYLDGLLSSKESTAFEARLGEDHSFTEEYQFRKSAHIYLKKKVQEEAFNDRLKSLNTIYFSKSDPIAQPTEVKYFESSRRIWFGIVAVAAIALLIILFPIDDGDLYIRHARHTPLALVEKSINTDLATKAQTAFNGGHYTAAYNDIKSYLSTNSNNLAAQLALGISALELNKYQEANIIFHSLVDSGTEFKNYGLWYLGLTKLKQGDIDGCKTHLKQMNVDADPYLLNKKNALMKDLK